MVSRKTHFDIPAARMTKDVPTQALDQLKARKMMLQERIKRLEQRRDLAVSKRQECNDRAYALFMRTKRRIDYEFSFLDRVEPNSLEVWAKSAIKQVTSLYQLMCERMKCKEIGFKDMKDLVDRAEVHLNHAHGQLKKAMEHRPNRYEELQELLEHERINKGVGYYEQLSEIRLQHKTINEWDEFYKHILSVSTKVVDAMRIWISDMKGIVSELHAAIVSEESSDEEIEELELILEKLS